MPEDPAGDVTDDLARGRTSADDAVSREEFSVFAHELRGALTIISGYSEILRRSLPDAERTAALDGILRAVGRADTLCTQVLAGRPSRTNILREPVRLQAVAENVAAEQRAATGRMILVDASDDPTVLGDEQALARALTNLVTNAAKYSPAETVVTIGVNSALTPQLEPTAVLEVSDRGCGIPLEERGRVFRPFERLARDEGIPGTGLGLAIVSTVVTSHRGSVEAVDNPGGGTTMRIELPAET